MSKLSIVVPVYNVEKYLAKCLDSLVHQSYDDFEVIVVNDGSIDHSQTIIDHYANKYPERIKSFIKENGGLSDARNFGLQQSKSEYVAFVDSDDYVDAELYKTLMDRIEVEKAEIGVCDLLYEYENGITKISSGGDFTCIDRNSKSSTLSLNNSACNKVFKRSLLEKMPFIKGIWYEDLATIPLIMLSAEKIIKVENVYYHYLQRDASIVHTKNSKIFDIYIALDTIRNGLDPKDNLSAEFNRMVVNQAVLLTNLRIKDYAEGCIDYWAMNHQRIQQFYKHWYFNSIVWTSGFKKWMAFTLFKFRLFVILDRLYS